MTRKQIAIFANGWSPEFITLILNGARRYAKEKNIDIRLFLTYATENSDMQERQGELDIFRLADLETFSGLIVLANTLCSFERVFLADMLGKVSIPVVCLEYEIPGYHFIGSDNYSGMYELAEHMFRDHKVTDYLYFSGPSGNAESAERLRAVSDAAEKYGIPFTRDNLYYGDWSFYSPVSLLNDYLSAHDSFPQAIMCGNDAMALGLCEKLADYSKQVPEDVFVTGFDGLESSTNYFPSLSSVARPWDNMGYDAAQLLLEEAGSAEEPIHKVMNSFMSIGESCGCTLCKEKAEKRLITTKENGRMHSSAVTFDMHMRSIYMHMRNVLSEEEFHNELTTFLAQAKQPFETGDFCMMLDPNFFQISDNEASDLKTNGYADELHSVVCLFGQQIQPIEAFASHELLPECFLTTEEPNCYLFTPLHIGDKNLGYASMRIEPKHFKEYMLYIWSRHILQNFEQLAQHIRIHGLTEQLTSLSVTDGLTGLYNRNGCIERAVPYYEDNLYHRQNVAIIMCDVDGMKDINDIYGHLQGDMALCTLSQAIKSSLPEDWYGCRYGGDEFLLLGKCEDEEALDKLMQRLRDNLQEQVRLAHLPYKLVSSMGGAFVSGVIPISFDAALKLADKNMYDDKYAHKAQTGKTVR